MAANRIFIQVDFQSQNAETQINALNQNIMGIGKASEQATNQASAGVKGFSVSIDQAKNAIDSLAQSITGLGIAQMVREILALGDAMLRTRIAFGHFAEGTDMMRELKTVADETGASLTDLEHNANQLKNAGVPIREITRDLKIFQDQAAFANASQEQLNAAVEAFSRLSAQKYT
jgi:hypothetical protein